jgi:hypothetical protein
MTLATSTTTPRPGATGLTSAPAAQRARAVVLDLVLRRQLARRVDPGRPGRSDDVIRASRPPNPASSTDVTSPSETPPVRRVSSTMRHRPVRSAISDDWSSTGSGEMPAQVHDRAPIPIGRALGARSVTPQAGAGR